jgi:hypothetical protein
MFSAREAYPMVIVLKQKRVKMKKDARLRQTRRLHLGQLFNMRRLFNKIRNGPFSGVMRTLHSAPHRNLAAISVLARELILNVAGDVGDLRSGVTRHTLDDGDAS